MAAVFQIAGLFAEMLCSLKIRCNSCVDSRRVEKLVWRGLISFYSLVGGTRSCELGLVDPLPTGHRKKKSCLDLSYSGWRSLIPEVLGKRTSPLLPSPENPAFSCLCISCKYLEENASLRTKDMLNFEFCFFFPKYIFFLIWMKTN